ncbi:hypothetical protein Bca101_025820 [Brassica carinata]
MQMMMMTLLPFSSLKNSQQGRKAVHQEGHHRQFRLSGTFISLAATLTITMLSQHCYGALRLLHFSRIPVLVVSSADAARDVLKMHYRFFASHPQNKIFEKLLYDGHDVASAPYGKHWRQMRSVSVIHLLSNKKVEKTRNDFDEFLERVFQDHEDGNGDRTDFVDVLLTIQREKSMVFEIERRSIKGIILDVFVGGTDIISVLMEWAMTEFLNHPTCLKRLQEEVHMICKGRSSVSEEYIEDIKYLKAVTKKTLRLHPPLPLMAPHLSTVDVRLGDYHIPVGTQVIIIRREATTWGIHAEEFRPESDRLKISITCKSQTLLLNMNRTVYTAL